MRQVFTVGRGAEADLRIDDRSVSRVHAEIVFLTDGRIYLTDCASSNGTAVGGESGWTPVRQGFVADGVSVRFGDVCWSHAELRAKLAHLARAVAAPQVSGEPTPTDGLPAGAVRRNSETGDIELAGA